MTRGKIAFIDDEIELCLAAEDWLTASGFEVSTYQDPMDALYQMELSKLDAVITDLRMPKMMGDQLLQELRQRDKELPIILMSAHADVSAAVGAMRNGALDFIEKPYLPEHLTAVLDRAVEWRRLHRALARAQAPQSRRDRVEQAVLGQSTLAAGLREGVLRLADVPVDLLIEGPIGSGREALARLIHDLSRRAKKPFIALDCRAISEEALEAELFGYERGAYAGRSSERHSRFEFAAGGTIFLSEIDGLSSGLQMRLYRALQDRQITRMGGLSARPIDIRLIAASSLDLKAAMQDNLFRADLYFRISAAVLQVPALRDRVQDLPQLYLYYLQQSAARLRRPLPEPSPAALEALKDRDWPGNLAELQAEAEREVLGLQTSRPTVPLPFEDNRTLAQKMASYEAKLITQALESSGGSSALAAEKLGLPRRTLNEKILRFGIRSQS